MAGEVLGSEWGPLAGMPAEEGLKIVSRYASSLEQRAERGDISNGEEEEEAEGVLGKKLAGKLKQVSMQPAATEFVTKRASAIAQARAQLRQKGKVWDDYGDYAEQIMGGVDAEKQTDPAAWVEAWWYCWGIAERNRQENPESHPRSNREEPEEEVYTETRGVPGSMNTDRNRRNAPRDEGSKFKITDPEERRTYGKFRQYLGLDISEEEWIRLQSEELKTFDQYQELQDDLKSKHKGARNG